MLSTETRAPSALHPLAPLSKSEMELATAILKADARVNGAHRFVTVELNEPDKPAVLGYAQGSRTDSRPESRPERQAFAVLLDRATGHCIEAVVSLDSGSVASWRAIEGVQPSIMPDEFVECEAAVKSCPEFIEALRKRGVDDANLAMVDPWSAGAYDTDPPEDAGRRLTRALVWVRSDPTDNAYARPVQNLVVVVDLNAMEVVRVEDYGVVPLPPESGNWTRNHIHETRTDLKPLEVVQDEGPSFSVDGHLVRWQNWQFRIGFTPREGVVLHTIGYEDGGRLRPIVYRASLSDMVVPYGAPDETGFRKNAFDIGEYGIGLLANSLTLGCDCLGHIRYFDAHMTDSAGRISTIENAICLHEEDNGILWKHTDWRTGDVEVRRSRRLVVSFISTVGNYEYAFYWNFYQDGSLELEVKLTGIANTTAVNPGEQTAHGVEIAPQLIAPYHQHIFNARLDMSVDGQNNSVYEVNSTRTPRGDGNPHGNAFTAERALFESELDAGRLCNLATSRYWRIANDSVPNRLGDAVGYRLLPGENCVPFADDDAAIIRRAGFLTKHLWVTPREERERYAAGDYPNQRRDGDGLPEWTGADRRIADTDVVVWYTFGHTHIPRMEDWPVMPAHKMGFMLKPDGFFDRNPALDLPPSPESHPCACDGSSCACGHSSNGPISVDRGCHC